MGLDDLRARLQELLDRGEGAFIGGGPERFLPLVTLDSGVRYGLDGEARWMLVHGEDTAPPGTPARYAPYAPGVAHLFHEALEWKRARFDDALEAAAREQGLPADDVLFSFPAVEVVRAVLARRHAYLIRIALEWLRPSELRELRAEILAVTRAPNLPVPVRELAERLVVPE